MTKPMLLSTLAAVLLLSSGCLFSKKPRTKETSAIASENEETLRRRWVEKRAGELTAQGTAADSARTQADQEFQDRYGFNQAKRK